MRQECRGLAAQQPATALRVSATVPAVVASACLVGMGGWRGYHAAYGVEAGAGRRLRSGAGVCAPRRSRMRYRRTCEVRHGGAAAEGITATTIRADTASSHLVMSNRVPAFAFFSVSLPSPSRGHGRRHMRTRDVREGLRGTVCACEGGGGW